jgi:hypothetical protein
MAQDPFISAALGPNAKLERMRAAALRLGGQGLKTTFDNHLLIIGDAAGHIDPLTGANSRMFPLVAVQPVVILQNLLCSCVCSSNALAMLPGRQPVFLVVFLDTNEWL